MTSSGEPVRYRISHRTTYTYGVPMADGYTVAYLLPRPTALQVVESASVTVDPVPDERVERTDVFSNRVLQLGVHHAHGSLSLDAESDVIVAPAAVPPPGEPWEVAAWRVAELRGGDALSVRPFAASSSYVALDQHGPALRAIAEEAFTPHRPLVDGVRALCSHIYRTFEYDPAFTDVSTPLGVVLAARRGVCQDFAHLAAGCLRSIGLAARYVSGYIETAAPEDPVASVGADASVPLVGADASVPLVGADASHAWCSVWVPQHGWVDFDPTNDHLPADRHVTLAWGRDYADVAPVRGVVIGPAVEQVLHVEVTVGRIV
jgi:transglutaminase-like putative cysteine protease